MAVAILKRADNLRHGLHGIGRRAAVDARVQIVIRALHVDLAVHNAAQPHADGGQFGREHFRIADHGGIGLEPRRLRGHVALDVLAAGFLFAFDQELHVHRQLAVRLQQAFDGFDQDVGLAFVVGGAARENVVAAHIAARRAEISIRPADRAAARRNGRTAAASVCRARPVHSA